MSRKTNNHKSNADGTNKKRARAKKSGGLIPSKRSLFKASILIAVWVAIAASLIVVASMFTLPDIDNIDKIDKKPSIIVKSSSGDIVATYGDVYGKFITYEELPKHLVDAVVATEDRRFFHHAGVDFIGIARAAWVNYQSGRVVQGGSTITQQLAKNIFLTSERTLKRKFQEALLAVLLEAKYSKKEILSIYLNRVYLGAGCFGVDAAAHRYFGKSATEIDVAESAIIVGLLKAPSSYSPTTNPELAEKRAAQIVKNMEDAGYITQQQAREEIMTILAGGEYGGASFNVYYYTDWLIAKLPELIGDAKEDIVIESTLDAKLQNLAEEKIKKVMTEQGKKANATQASLVLMKPNGAVLAIVGGKNYRASQYNRAFQSQRQPGSAFKTFIYITALKQGVVQNDFYEDMPISYGSWRPTNYGGEYEGLMTVREAFSKSVNTIAVQMIEKVGIGNVISTANEMGIKSPMGSDLSLALGTSEVNLVELTSAYSTIANNGIAKEPYGIKKIYNKAGELIYEHKEDEFEQVISSDVVSRANDLLASVVESGTGRRAIIDRPSFGKTGTSQEFRDAWFIGYTGNLVAGVWVGNDNNKSMKKVTGGSIPASIWHDVMLAAHAGLPVIELPRDFGSPAIVGSDGVVDNSVNNNPNAQATEIQDNPSQEEDDGKSSESFWEKIFSETGDGKVEYEYPKPERN